MPTQPHTIVVPTKSYYIATTLTNVDQYEFALNIFRPDGWELTYDWRTVGKVEDDNMRPIIAMREQDAIIESFLVLMLLPAGRGTHVEMGMAIAYRKPVILLAETDEQLFGDYGFPPCFYRHPNVHRARTWKDAKFIASALWQMYGGAR